MRIEIDGNDGTGKSTIVNDLRAAGFQVQDRGRITKATDDDGVEPELGVLYILLDVPVQVSRQRLAEAGKDMTERYHTVDDLTYYRTRFVAAGKKFGAHYIDADRPIHSVRRDVLRVIRASTFVDLHDEVSRLQETTVAERVQELTRRLGGAYITAIGGFAVTRENDRLLWCGGEATPNRVRDEVTRGVGLSGVTTFMNKSRKDAMALGHHCLVRGHTWAYHWMTLSVVFVGFGQMSELAFARDTRFFMSWPVERPSSGQVFVATASIKAWHKFTSRRDEKGFDADARAAMADAHRVVRSVLPEGRP